jgi:hypothetical protein
MVGYPGGMADSHQRPGLSPLSSRQIAEALIEYRLLLESRPVSADLPAHKDLRTTSTGRGTPRDWFNAKLQSRLDCRLLGTNYAES